MQLTYIQTVMAASDGIQKVTAMCYSPNDRRLAVCLMDRIVYLFDENGERREKFSTKPADKGPKNYVVRAMAFSPDSNRLAIAQSDNSVFVYKLGLEWGDKKSICNKLIQSSPITSLVWPLSRLNEFVFGLAEGKVKVGVLKTNKPQVLYTTDSYVVALASNPDGTGTISAHLDGSIHRFLFSNSQGGTSHVKIAHHPCVPYALAWGHHICVAGNDSAVVFYDNDGGLERTFDYSNDPTCREFTTAVFNPTGEAVIVGNFDSFYIFNLNARTETWEDVGVKKVPNMYSVTSLAWKRDGSRVAIGTLCGVCDTYDACIKRSRYKGKFEFTYVSPSQVIVKRLSNGSRIILKSLYGCEITKINIFQDQYVAGNTASTLLLGDLNTLKLSEVQWHSPGNEKFVFDNPSVCMVYSAGELSLIEYGCNEVLGSVRTEFMSGHLLSVRINERPPRKDPNDHNMMDNNMNDPSSDDNKKMAYLLDTATVAVKDLSSGQSSTVNHDCRIDWLELNTRGNLLLFRDKRRHLHLFDVETQVRTTLLSFCTYVQWVPESDVVVAQNRGNLCVWYNIHATDQVTVHAIRGDVEEIERVGGRTEVIVDEGISAASYLLDEALITFGTAIDDRDYSSAIDILETLEMSPEAEGMWRQLSEQAMANRHIAIAERCAAALGDVGRARFLRKVGKLIDQAGTDMGLDHWSVRAQLAILNKDLRGAEDIMLGSGQTEPAIEMYRKVKQFDEAIIVAESRKHPEASRMRDDYLAHLLSTRQEERAAQLKEQEGDYDKAIALYLKGGLPAKAANVIKSRNMFNDTSLLERVATSLTSAGLHDRAGELYEEMGQLQRGLDSYIKGHAFRQAVELSRRHFPSQVVELQESWGDWLVNQKQVDMAINHFIEANCSTKAIEAALSARQWQKAAQFAENLDLEAARPYYKRIARHYEQCKQLDEAEKYFIAAQSPKLAVEMFTKASLWDRAHKLATTYMSEREVSMLYISQAQRMEASGKLKEAEQLYVKVNEPDLAINMYKKQRKYDAMVRLVGKYRKELLKETHQFLAQHLESEGNLRDAEHHYCEANEWLSAVNMFRSNNMWEEAIRVAKLHGGANASKRVAYAWALALGGEAGAKLLTKLGLIEPAIEYAMESGAFDHAFELARCSLQRKLPEIHLKHALYLEDEEKYPQAEEEFVHANKPREAVDMYVHQQDWTNAMRVAETYDPAAVPEVYVGEAKACVERRDWRHAEELFVAAAKPELALAMYQEAGLWDEALALTQQHLPHKLNEVHMAHQSAAALRGVGGSKSDFIANGRIWETSGQWSQAIDAYLTAKAGVLPPDDLEEVWEHAVRIAKKDLRSRYLEVVAEVTRRLREIKRHEGAAELLREAQQLESAVECAMEGECWSKARELAQGAPGLEERVERSYQTFLSGQGNTDGLLELGATNAALDVLAKAKDWNRLWEMANKEHISPAERAQYAAMRVQQLLDEGGSGDRLDEAVRTLDTHGAPNSPSYSNLYLELTRQVLGRNSAQIEAVGEAVNTATIMTLRKVLFNLKNLPNIEDALMACHYTNIAAVCQSLEGKDMMELRAKVFISLLRYAQIIPVDKLFYQAGEACKKQGHTNLAFVLLNRYVDLTEAIEEGDSNLLDNSDFASATAVSFVDSLPTQQFLPDEDSREEVRDWVLSVCMDNSVDQTLPSEGPKTMGTIYAGLYSSDAPRCVVSGAPISSKSDELRVNGTMANKRDWNLIVSKTKVCPWTGSSESPQW
jgi:intraflagellar transport protein 172